MERKSDEERPTAADARAGDKAAAGRAAQERARAYLDLWESHVVQTALHGPIATCHPAKS